MIVVTVARKPLSEVNVASNVLKHECGALNIKAARIGYGEGEVDFGKVQRQQSSGDGVVQGAFGASHLVGSEIATYKPEGRWPANLVLTVGGSVADLDAQSGIGASRYFKQFEGQQ